MTFRRPRGLSTNFLIFQVLMIIEDTINEIGDFLKKLLNTGRLLIVGPRTMLAKIEGDQYEDVLRPNSLFLIAYLGFLCISLSNAHNKGVADRLNFDELVVNLKHVTDNLTEVERSLYLAALLLVIYFTNILISYLLFVPKKQRKKFQQFVLYYISLNVIAFILLEILQLFLGEHLLKSHFPFFKSLFRGGTVTN
jgi:hypothetical protein